MFGFSVARSAPSTKVAFTMFSICAFANYASAATVSGFVKTLGGVALQNVQIRAFEFVEGAGGLDLDNPIGAAKSMDNGFYLIDVGERQNVVLLFDGALAVPLAATSAFIPQAPDGGGLVGGSLRMIAVRADGSDEVVNGQFVFRNVTDLNVGLPERVSQHRCCCRRCARRCR